MDTFVYFSSLSAINCEITIVILNEVVDLFVKSIGVQFASHPLNTYIFIAIINFVQRI